MERIPPFSSQQLEAISKLLDTSNGLTGPEIGRLLKECSRLKSVSPNERHVRRLRDDKV